jgi:hypothetical protein
MKKNTRHKKVIIAFLEGKDIEIQGELTERWYPTENPKFETGREYRIKPREGNWLTRKLEEFNS